MPNNVISQKNSTIVAHMMAGFTAIIWGTTFISTKVLLRSFDPIDILIYRFAIGYVILWLLKPKKLIFQGWKKEGWYLLAGLCGITIYFLCENISLTMTQAGNASIIVSTAPMFTALFAFLTLKEEKPTKNFWLGFFLAMAGIVLINVNGMGMDVANIKGDLLALCAAAVWGIYSIILRKHVDTKSDVIVHTRRVMFYGLLTMIPCGVVLGFRFDPQILFTPLNMGNLIFLGMLATAGGYVTWNYALEHLGVMHASAYIYVIPVITIITSTIILQEKVTLEEVLGCGLTIVGLLLSEKKKKTKTVG